MPPYINRVRWSASNLPWGINFDEQTGTFSGTPDEPGAYVIPVRVDTNYGYDQKNITINIEDKPYAVYAKSKGSTDASDWSNGAAEDSDGFRKINMPKASSLVPYNAGFGARVEGGGWYVVGAGSYTNMHGVAGFSASDTPQRFTVNNVVSMAGGYSTGSVSYFSYLTSDNVCHMKKRDPQSGSAAGPSAETGNVLKLSSGMTAGFCYLQSDRTIHVSGPNNTSLTFTAAVSAEQIKTLVFTGAVNATGTPVSPFYITHSGDLYQGTQRISFSGGMIRNIFTFPNNTQSLFVATENNRLYAQGSNLSYTLGFTTTSTRNSLELVGYYDVKKVVGSASDGSLILTSDGKLYHTGTYINSSITGITRTIGTKHQGFVQVFPNKKFHDIAVVGGTIVATIEE